MAKILVDVVELLKKCTRENPDSGEEYHFCPGCEETGRGWNGIKHDEGCEYGKAVDLVIKQSEAKINLLAKEYNLLAGLLDMFENLKWEDAGPFAEYKPEDEKYITSESFLSVISRLEDGKRWRGE